MNKCLSLVLMLAATPCVAADDERFAAATECYRQAQRVDEIKINSGIYSEQVVANAPLSIKLPLGIDQGIYNECIQRQGLVADISRDPYFKIVQECRDQQLTQHKVIGQGRDMQIARAKDGEDFEACLRRGVGTLDVEVEPQPAGE